MVLFKYLLITLQLLLIIVAFPVHSSAATTFQLYPPEGALSRGQEIQFIITIDTAGASVTAAQIGLTYQTADLQYLSTTPGSAFTSIAVSQLGGGKLLFTKGDTLPFSGSEDFAYVNFKIISTAPGSSELCVLWAPSPTPTIPPTATPPPGTTAIPTVLPTRLPTSGSTDPTDRAGVFGALLLMAAVGLYAVPKFISRRHHYQHKPGQKRTA